MTIRPVTTAFVTQQIDDNTQQWAHQDQPFKAHGIHMQTRRTRTSAGYDVRAEAVDVVTGELIASASHSRFAYDAVRSHLVQLKAA